MDTSRAATSSTASRDSRGNSRAGTLTPRTTSVEVSPFVAPIVLVPSSKRALTDAATAGRAATTRLHARSVARRSDTRRRRRSRCHASAGHGRVGAVRRVLGSIRLRRQRPAVCVSDFHSSRIHTDCPQSRHGRLRSTASRASRRPRLSMFTLVLAAREGCGFHGNRCSPQCMHIVMEDTGDTDSSVQSFPLDPRTVNCREPRSETARRRASTPRRGKERDQGSSLSHPFL